MQIAKDTVVFFTFALHDSKGNVLEQSSEAVSYLHGGYDGIFPLVEQALEGKGAGESLDLSLEPQDAFGDYDSELVQLESIESLPGDVEVGMRFEGNGEAGEHLIYTVTEIADGKAVLDPNHPLAGQKLRFTCTVTEVRVASPEELSHGHVHGPDGHHH
ncbi:MAG: peptidylprolyl isomerase [Sulfuricellaceae bacterium]|nr:peptidylprolyl isomerase [Sulfuricellaceae bacterium]